MHAVMSRRLKCAVAALSLSVLAGCSWFTPKDPRFEPSPLTEYPAGVSASTAWSVNIGSGGGSGFVPVLVGDGVYAATPNGNVVKTSLTSGGMQWRADAGIDLSAGVGSDGITTAVAGPDGTVVAFDDQGQEKWRAQATSEVFVPPVVGAGVVVVRSSDYRIQAFDAATGDRLWSVQRPGPALALKTNMQMLIIEGVVISGLPNGRLIVISAQDGAVQWEGTVSTPRGATDLERINDVVGAPQTQGSLLCGASYQGRIVCFDIAQGGIPVWEQPFSTTTGIASDSRQVYGAAGRDSVYAFSLTDGGEQWRQDALRNRRLSGPAVVGSAVAFGDYDGYVHFLSSSDGRLLGRIQVGGGAVVSPLVSTPRGVLVQTGNGSLVLVGVN
ncbi:outer membrane protein assembly factor BamB [Pusillimonas sp. 7-48]|uniref:Outer membrane protein assembly factor BamB n=2 Tax=Pusillimonas minor TaxID=2697024 RepID=A0A842HRJ5_9BURK|nr:outer membrane protein assembly factor BamB [Pusillimonas minor]